ncbi:hypothetical protein CPB85DRAFT_1430245 [Mucidula mucida]|nr:hypothetical protein CPB85DRAFT_1430245 [Mucidula mucida]
MKIAFTQDGVQRLRHEDRVYRHLQEAGVSGIPSLLGFLENPDASLCVLFLSDCGSHLESGWSTGKLICHQRRSSSFHIHSPPCVKRFLVREDLTSILASIHDAGILHRDVRSWNILEDAEGRVRFTDFDRGSFQARPKDYLAEKQRLERFLRGEFVDRADIIGQDDLGETYPIDL